MLSVFKILTFSLLIYLLYIDIIKKIVPELVLEKIDEEPKDVKKIKLEFNETHTEANNETSLEKKKKFKLKKIFNVLKKNKISPDE